MHRWLNSFAAAAIALAISPVGANAQWPDKTIQIMVGNPVGGAFDILNRALIAEMGQELGVNMISLPTPGAGGMVALQKLVQARPDGNTLMLMPSAAFLARPLQMGIDIGLDDVTVIGSVARSVSFISVQKESPVLGLPEVVETAKNDPLAIDYATTGLGGIPHMAMSLLEKATGGKFTIVTFGGSPQAILAAVGGQTDLAVTDVTNEGLRPIAAISEKRSSFYPDVPTLSDLGYGIGMSSIFFVIAPKGIPEDVASELEKQLLAAIEKPSVQDTLKKLQLDSAVQAGADTVKELERQSDMYRSVLSDLGLLGAESGK